MKIFDELNIDSFIKIENENWDWTNLTTPHHSSTIILDGTSYISRKTAPIENVYTHILKAFGERLIFAREDFLRKKG